MSEVNEEAEQGNGSPLRGVLPAGTTLRGYELISILGQGAFGITYRARDLALGRDVAIKEYLPATLALREGRTPADADWGVTPPDEYGRLGAGGATEPYPTLPGAYQQYYAGIAQALRGQAPVPVEPRDAVAALTVIEAARRSADEHRTVTL